MWTGVIRPCWRCSASRRACSSASSSSLEILSRSMAMRVPPAQCFVTVTPAAFGAAGRAAFPRGRGRGRPDSYHGSHRRGYPEDRPAAQAEGLAGDLAVGLAGDPTEDLAEKTAAAPRSATKVAAAPAVPAVESGG